MVDELIPRSGSVPLLQGFKVQYAAFMKTAKQSMIFRENLFFLELCVASSTLPQDHNLEENPQRL